MCLNDKEQTFVKRKHPVLTLHTLLRDRPCVQLTRLNSAVTTDKAKAFCKGYHQCLGRTSLNVTLVVLYVFLSSYPFHSSSLF